MLLTYQDVPKEETTQTGVQYDLHTAELRIPLDTKTDATGPTDMVFHLYSGFIFHAVHYRPTVYFWYPILYENTYRMVLLLLLLLLLLLFLLSQAYSSW